jgi:hypothetical protein
MDDVVQEERWAEPGGAGAGDLGGTGAQGPLPLYPEDYKIIVENERVRVPGGAHSTEARLYIARQARKTSR